MGRSARVEVAGLVCRLGELAALEGVSLSVSAGTLFGIVGPNGAGKTTLLRALAGAIGPDAGSVLVDGRVPRRTPAAELARVMAVLPQHPLTPAGLTVREAVGWGRAPHLGRLSRAAHADARAVREALEATGTLPLADRAIDGLSGGETQRVLIARALAQTPRILLLDEPTAHLDIAHQVEVMELLVRLAAQGLTIVAALHDLNIAAAYCAGLALLAGGRLVASGPPADVLQPDKIRQTYGAAVTVRANSATGRPYVVVAGVTDRTGSGPRIHVICGGGTGADFLTRCAGMGYRMSAGVLHVMDTDDETARILGLEAIEEAPFSPVSDEALHAALDTARRAAAVVVAPVPIGPGNLRNLEIAEAALASGVPVIMVDGIAARDFAGGAATTAAARLVRGGARVVADLQEAVEAVRHLAPVLP